MKKILLTTLFIYPFLSFGQIKQHEILNNLIFKFTHQQVQIAEIQNELGIAKDTLKNTLYYNLPTYSNLGLSFLSMYIGYYNYLIVDVSKFKTGFKSKFLNFKPNISFKEFIATNKLPSNITIFKKNIRNRQYYNRVFLFYDNYEVISEPQSDEAIAEFQKSNLNDISLIEKHSNILKKIRCNFIWCTFEGEFSPPPSIQELK